MSDILAVLRRLPPYRVGLASCASALLQTGVMASLTVFLTKSFDVSVPAAAGVGTLAEVINAVGCLVVGPMLKRGTSSAHIASIGAVVLVAGAVLLYLPNGNFALAALGVSVFALGIGLTNSLIWSLVPSTTPDVRMIGITSGLVAQATYLGVLLGPPLIFSTLNPGGWINRICVVVVMMLLQVAPLAIWKRRTAEPQPLAVAP